MGHQVLFYLSPADSFKFESELASIEVSVIVHGQSRGPYPKVVDLSEARTWLFTYLVRRVDLDSVLTKHVPTQGYWIIDELRSPVIEITRCYYDGQLLRRGRFYYNDAYYDDAGQPCGKSPGFSDWAKKVLSKARRILTYNKQLGAYVGEEAIQLHEKGVVLKQF